MVYLLAQFADLKAREKRGREERSELMLTQIEAIYEHGVLRPLQLLTLAEGEKVALNVISTAEIKAKRLSKAERNARDLAIINRNADRLNEEAMDVLQYQIEL